ncbi:MAPK regulated corepressor interacting protein 2-like [Pollicipes pollicipes]|uniref:MAPK regulated corepressor interacting protein 2-like n=1 Tax=Pollicipes pollicipes TaxID=41117 RepID=UPI0018859F1E|nr:MAPK regulated corepressor interacting protein 2-like [Pollicipes pollicipes]
MYTVSKGPSKIVARTRRGLTQKLESLDAIRDLTRKSSSEPSPPSSPEMSSPRPVFSEKRRQNSRSKPTPTISPQHEEVVRYLAHTWRRVKEEYANADDSGGGDIESLYYDQVEVHPALQDFQPFDLEAWWGQRLYQQLTGSMS